MNDSPYKDPLVIEVSVWFRENGEDKKCLLPQNLPTALLLKLTGGKSQINGADAPRESGIQGLLTAVGLMLADESRQFGASREELAIFVKAYSFNLMLESLIRAGIITAKKPFSGDDLFDISFERYIALTDLGREAAKQAGNPLASLLAGFGEENH